LGIKRTMTAPMTGNATSNESQGTMEMSSEPPPRSLPRY
jgi:hypothetical protein